MARLHTLDAETGDLSGWFSTTGTGFTNTTEQANGGTRSYKSDTGDPASQAWAARTFSGAVGTTVYSRFYLYVPVLPGANTFVARYRTGTPSFLVSVQLTSNGTLFVRDDIAFGTLITTGSGAITINTWYLVEIAIQINGSTGDDAVELRINESSIGSTTTADLGTAAPGRFEVGQISTAAGINYLEYFDDIAINDATGGTDNTWPGAIVTTTPQKAYLVTDVTDGSWTTDTGGTDLAAAVDETTANDADYIQSSADPVSDTVELAFGSLTDPASSDDHIVRYRIARTGPGPINATVKLMQGTTEIASWSHTNLTDTLATIEQTLTGTEADAITNYSDLRLRITAAV